jgi:branched-chain amino acid transport system substrate-binding protein
MRSSGRSLLAAAVAIVLASCSGGSGSGQAGRVIRIGVVTNCGGGLSSSEPEVAGAELPLIQRGAELIAARPSDGVGGAVLAGRPVKLILGCEDFMNHMSAITALSMLVDRDRAQIVIAGSNPGDGMAVREFAKHHAGVTFLLTSFEQSATLKDPAPNVFRFEVDSAQWAGGLGTYAYRSLGWKRAATLGEGDLSGWPEVAGFDAEFCSLGGRITDRVWAPGVDPHLARRARQISKARVDGVFLPGDLQATGGFVRRWRKRHPDLGRHLLVGWAPLVGADRSLRGVVGASPDPFAATARWRAYRAAFSHAFPGLRDPDLIDQPYFDEMEPVAVALERVHGDLSHGERRFMTALANLRYDSPEGMIRLDKRHQAIGPIYLGRVVPNGTGGFVIRQIAIVRNVDQTFHGYFSPTSPAPSVKQPACVRRGSTT